MFRGGVLTSLNCERVAPVAASATGAAKRLERIVPTTATSCDCVTTVGRSDQLRSPRDLTAEAFPSKATSPGLQRQSEAREQGTRAVSGWPTHFSQPGPSGSPIGTSPRLDEVRQGIAGTRFMLIIRRRPRSLHNSRGKSPQFRSDDFGPRRVQFTLTNVMEAPHRIVRIPWIRQAADQFETQSAAPRQGRAGGTKLVSRDPEALRRGALRRAHHTIRAFHPSAPLRELRVAANGGSPVAASPIGNHRSLRPPDGVRHA
jgi:hypothetical protein